LTAINTTAVATNQGFKSLIPSDRVDVGYLYWWLTTNRRRMEALGRGATFKEVSKAIVAGVRIPLPPLEEQRRIAAVLDKADEVRAKRRAALEQLDMLTQSIFLDMFGDVDPSTSSWPSAKVGSFVSHFEAGKSLVAVADEDAAGPYRVLKVSAVTSWEYSPEESKAVPAGYVPPSAHVVRRNDLLFSRANTSALVGATAMVHDTPTNLLLSDKLWRFVFSDPGDADPYFVWALFRSRHVRDAVMRRATGTSGSMKNISQKKVLGIEVAWPPQDLRREFSRRARLAQHNRLRTRDAAEGCDTLFASLQSRAFRGEL
jgi:type I restriction enzyme S subunit